MSRYPLNLPTELHRAAAELAERQGVSLNQFILWSLAEKVGELRRGLDDPRFPGITYRRGAAGEPTPVIRGTGVRVQTVVTATQHWDMSAAEVAADYDLPIRQVEECLAFFEAHRPEVSAAIAQEDQLAASDG